MKSAFAPLLGLALITTLSALPARAADNGIVSVASAHDVATTLDRLESLARAKGIQIFARIDHADGAAKAGLNLRPTQLLILGHPKAGTPIMNAAPTSALDLPLKALAWQEAAGKVWVSYNNPAWLTQRHGLAPEFEKNVAALAGLVKAAVE